MDVENDFRFIEPVADSQLRAVVAIVTGSPRRIGVVLLCLASIAASLMGTGLALAQNLTGNFPIPTASALPYGITAGPDGNVWFAESNSNKVGRITPGGTITEFPTPTLGSAPNQIATGSDGNLWATLEVPNAIARITTAGVVTQFPVLTGNSHVNGIAAGADGNLWFAEENANKIGRITTLGAVTEFATPTAGSDPISIALGPDGNIWFTETNVNKIGRITIAGAITEFTSPSFGQPFGITGGPDGNVWYTKNTAVIGRITPAGVITEFPVANAGRGITTGPDGNLWYPTGYALTIGRITPSGVATEFPLAAFGGTFIVTGPDGNLWITGNNNNILRFSVNSVAPAPPVSLTVGRMGNGTVTSNPPGIACGSDCTENYVIGTAVSLLATPNAGWVFSGWSGACAGTGVCMVSMPTALSVTATFTFTGAGSANSNEWVQKAYVAYYGRPADPGGLAYWASRMDAEGGSLSSIIAAFGNSAEYNQRYGGLSFSDLIDILYQQTLGRAPDPGGKQYYLDRLNAGLTNPQTIMLDLLGGATGLDALTVANRLDVANHYTGKVAAGCPYGGELAGVASLASVTSDPATVWAAKLAIETRCGP